MNNYIDLALLNSKNVLNSCVIGLNVFIEDYVEDKFALIDSLNIQKKDGEWKCKIFGLIKLKKDKNRDLKEVVCSRNHSESISYKKIDGWEDAIIDETHRSTKIVGALFYYYGFCNY